MSEVVKGPDNGQANVWRALPYRVDQAERAVIAAARAWVNLEPGSKSVDLTKAVMHLEDVLAPRPER